MCQRSNTIPQISPAQQICWNLSSSHHYTYCNISPPRSHPKPAVAWAGREQLSFGMRVARGCDESEGGGSATFAQCSTQLQKLDSLCQPILPGSAHHLFSKHRRKRERETELSLNNLQ